MNIINAWSKNGVIEFTRRIDGDKVKTKIKDFKWYFYVKKEDVSLDVLDIIKKYAYHLVCGKEYYKIFVVNNDYNKFDHERGKFDDKNNLIRELRHAGVRTYEADLPLYKRWIIDESIGIDPNPLIGYLDIETDDRHGGIEIGRDQILSFACRINGKTHFVTEDTELAMLHRLAKCLEHLDIICTWNGINFDLPYIMARFEKYGIRFYKREIIHFDLMEIFKKRYKYKDNDNPITNFNLENISRIILGRGKVRYTGSIYDLWDKDRETLGKYNCEDVNLLNDLDDKVGIFKNISGICEVSKTPYRDYYVSEIVDYFIMSEAKKVGRILPSSEYKLSDSNDESEKKKYAGAFVFDVVPGLYDDVVVFDFSSQYPSNIRTFNIGTDTHLGDKPVDGAISTINGQYFDSSRESTVALCCRLLVDERAKVRQIMKGMDETSMEWQALNNKQDIYKVLSNSIYGAIGSTYTRYYHKDLAEAVTLSARHVIEKVIQWTTEMGYMTVLSDTDSIALAMNGRTHVGLNDELMVRLKEYLEKTFNIKDFPMKLSLDKIFKKLLIVAKKNYVAIKETTKADKIEVKGLEYIKSDTCKYAATIQKDLVSKILNENKRDYDNMIRTYKQDYDKIMVTKDNLYQFIINERVTKNPKKYVSTSVSIALAKEMIDRGMLFYPGMFVGYIITGVKDGKVLGVLPSDFMGVIDKDYLWDKQILPKLTRIVEVLSPDIDFNKYSNAIMANRLERKNMYKVEMFNMDKKNILQTIKNDKVLSDHDKNDLLRFFDRNRLPTF